jgi:hypothetical protein
MKSTFTTTRRFFFFIAVVTMFAGIIGAPVRSVAAAERCFAETGFCITGRIQEYWQQNGGLPVFGYPISAVGIVSIDGKQVIAQRFERNRLELHPTNQRPYDVLLGRLGADRLAQTGRDWNTFPTSASTPGCVYFAQTRHNVCGEILSYWKAHGLNIDGKAQVTDAESLALFGLPLSPLQTERMADGKEYQVQWFERARFELHPENVAPYTVQLGLLGNELGVPSASPEPTVTQPVAAVPTAPSAEELEGFVYRMPVGGLWRTEKNGIIVEVRNFGYFKNPDSLDRSPTRFVECQIAVINDPTKSGYAMNITDMVFMLVDGAGASNGVHQKWIVEETGIPHRTQGRFVFLITKNQAPTTLIANIWGMSLDINLKLWPIPD